MAPIILYNLDLSPPCRAVLLTAKCLGVEMTIKNIDFFDGNEHESPAFLKMNPAHTVPTIDDNGFYLWESRAIMGYLVQKYAKDDSLYPKEPKLRAIVDQMLYFDADNLYHYIFRFFVLVVYRHKKPEQALLDRIHDMMASLNTILKNSPYAAGKQLTIADIALVVSVTTLDAMSIDYTKNCPDIVNWVKKVKKEIKCYDEVNQPGDEALKKFYEQELPKAS